MLHQHCASFDKLGMRGFLHASKTFPHPELAEGRTVPLQAPDRGTAADQDRFIYSRWVNAGLRPDRRPGVGDLHVRVLQLPPHQPPGGPLSGVFPEK
jgi:hypothetical protein